MTTSTGKIKVTIRCEEVCVYRKTLEIPASAFAEYEAAVARDDKDYWFAEFAERFIDRIHDEPTSDGFEDVEVTAALAKAGG